MHSFIELLKDHALILSAANSLQAIAAGHEAEPGTAYNALRRLARLLEAHLRAEAEFIRIDGEDLDPEFAALAAEHDERFDGRVLEWSGYLQGWNEETIARDWAGFGANTQTVIAALTAQIEAENRSLYPAALKYGLIRLMPEQMREAIDQRSAAWRTAITQ